MPSAIAREVTVPITRFETRREAHKIFDEVNEYGSRVVLDNSNPTCVLVSPEKYCSMVDEIQEARLYALVAERIANDNGVRYSFDEILAMDGMTREELDKIPMEYGVDFE